MCHANNSDVALYPSFTIVIPPTFPLQPVTLFVGSAGRATISSRPWLDPAAAPIDGGAEQPAAWASGNSQELLRAICVLQHLQTVNPINNVNICQTHMEMIVVSMTIVKCKWVLFIRTHPSASVDLPLHREVTTGQLGMLLLCTTVGFHPHLDSVTVSLLV